MYHSLTYDSARGVSILFGGAEDNGPTVFGDTWQFNGSDWTKVSAQGPSPRLRHAACYDSQRKQLVIFGGVTAAGKELNDTWAFDGAKWTQIHSLLAPSARYGVAMSYDARRDRIVLFGGLDESPQLFGDTWEFDGSQWTQRRVIQAPDARQSHAMAYDSKRDRTVLFGGSLGLGGFSSETWEWDGTAWNQIQTPTTPTTFVIPAMAYNPFHQVMVLVGSQGALSTPPKTLAFDGTEWHPGPPAPAGFRGRLGHGLCFDTRHDAAVLFGGGSIGRSGALEHDDTWLLSTPARFSVFGRGCSTSAGVLELRSSDRPRLGAAITIEATQGPSLGNYVLFLGGSKSTFAGLKLPFDLGKVGIPGCQLLVSMDRTDPMQSTPTGAALSLKIPVEARLLGATVFAQACLIGADPATSNAAELTLGN